MGNKRLQAPNPDGAISAFTQSICPNCGTVWDPRSFPSQITSLRPCVVPSMANPEIHRCSRETTWDWPESQPNISLSWCWQPGPRGNALGWRKADVHCTGTHVGRWDFWEGLRGLVAHSHKLSQVTELSFLLVYGYMQIFSDTFLSLHYCSYKFFRKANRLTWADGPCVHEH